MKKACLFLLLLLLLTATSALAACDHDFDMDDVKLPTCETDGYYILVCKHCGYTKKEITDKAWGHDWTLIDERAATCTDAGYQKFECENCGKIKTDTLPRKEHKWKNSHVLEEATCTRDGTMRVYCTVCGLTSSQTIKKGHKYGDWTITEEATDHSKGTRTRTCRVCKKKETDTFYPEGTLYKDIKNHTDEVKALQELLTDLDFLNDKIDGLFGKKTQAAVKAFQKKYGLNADGIAWPQTLHALRSEWDRLYGMPTEPDASNDSSAPFCSVITLENGSEYWDTCAAHSAIFMHAADALPEDADEAAVLRACIAAWQAELDRLYQTWLERCAPEEQPLVINHKTMFQGYLNSQQMLWNVQYGANTPQALQPANDMLMEQCCTLCSVVYALSAAK